MADLIRRFQAWLAEGGKLRWAAFFAGAALVVLIALAGGITAWEYTNSPQFCGTICHQNVPEYTAYIVSPHARVPCVDCHLGVESTLTTVPRKAQEIRHVVGALTQRYETPVYVRTLRPARETCERCHFPEKFSDDSFREIRRYAADENNTETRIYLILKTGGGTAREGLGKGIHWHIENEVWYLATDELRQNIPYVRQIDLDGTVTEYFDLETPLAREFIEKNEDRLRLMDCIDCHTRISHLFRSPERAMDQALSRRLVDRTIPEIYRKGVELLSAEYADHETARQEIAQLEDWYRANHPEFFDKNREIIAQAVVVIQDIYTSTVFPDMDVGWLTHPNNIGHLEFPGCFRCHDGKHVSDQGSAIRLECNVCHTVPAVQAAGQPAPIIAVSKPGEPGSHLDTQWLNRHRFEFDATCANCHDVSNPGGTDNSSFCSNSACHAIEWRFAGLNAPGVAELVARPEPPDGPPGVAAEIPHPIGPDTDCLLCHGGEGVRPFPADHEGRDVSWCTTCHEPTLLESGVPPAQAAPPDVPHPVEGRENCLACHEAGIGGAPQFRDDHQGRPNDACLICHRAEGDRSD